MQLIVPGVPYSPFDQLSRGVVIQLIVRGGHYNPIDQLSMQGGGRALNCVRGGITTHLISCPGGRGGGGVLATNYVQGSTLPKLSVHRGCILTKWNSPMCPTHLTSQADYISNAHMCVWCVCVCLHTVKTFWLLQPYFGPSSDTLQTSREASTSNLNLNQSVVENLLQKAYKSAFLVRLGFL